MVLSVERIIYVYVVIGWFRFFYCFGVDFSDDIVLFAHIWYFSC